MNGVVVFVLYKPFPLFRQSYFLEAIHDRLTPTIDSAIALRRVCIRSFVCLHLAVLSRLDCFGVDQGMPGIFRHFFLCLSHFSADCTSIGQYRNELFDTFTATTMAT